LVEMGKLNNLILKFLKILQRNGMAVVLVCFLPYFYIMSID
jgi:hypothetical protein